MFTVGQLLLGVGQLLIAVCDLLLCVSQLLLGVGNLLFCFGLTCVIIRPAVFEFLFCVFQLLPAIFQLLPRIFQFLLLFFQRFFRLVQLFLVFRERLVRRVCRQIQLILIVGQSVLALVQLRLRRCKLPTRRRGELVFAKPPAAVLDITGNACVAEVKLLAGKAVVKGELRVQCAWRAEGDTALQSQAAALPFQQVIDLEGITEDCRCLCVAEPVGFTLSQAESAAAQLTANVMLHLRAWRSYQLQVAVDAFSTRFETELTPQPLVTEQLLCTLNDTATATGSGPLPDAGAQLRACFVHYGPQQAVQKGEGWVLAAKAVATALAENTLGELESYEKTLEVAVPLPITPPEGTVLVPECWLSTENMQCTCAGGTLEATITVRAEGTILGCTTSPVIGSITLGDPLPNTDPEIALRIYYAQAGEEVFAVARRFHVAPAQILAANQLEEELACLPQAQRLLIPVT